ncbi:MAG: hypothetical protein EOP49_41025 [Sphingobacteriales bacterium]|nr:MAG: hypothetical protein EOP49_41025 [Sphingobacteriales bacterium]
MKNTTLFLIAALLFVSCKKEKALVPTPPPAQPQMRHMPLNDIAVHTGRARSLDVDGDGTTDFAFYVQLVGDPVLQIDKMQFCVGSGVKRNLLVNDANETPLLQPNDEVKAAHAGFNWWEVSESVLAEKRIGWTETWWDGLWKNAKHRFLAVQVQKPEGLYHGWVELSMDTSNSKLILHRAAIAKQAGRAVRAGI